MKKILTLFISILMILTIGMPVVAEADTINYIWYTLNEVGDRIEQGSGSANIEVQNLEGNKFTCEIPLLLDGTRSFVEAKVYNTVEIDGVKKPNYESVVESADVGIFINDGQSYDHIFLSWEYEEGKDGSDYYIAVEYSEIPEVPIYKIKEYKTDNGVSVLTFVSYYSYIDLIKSKAKAYYTYNETKYDLDFSESVIYDYVDLGEEKAFDVKLDTALEGDVDVTVELEGHRAYTNSVTCIKKVNVIVEYYEGETMVLQNKTINLTPGEPYPILKTLLTQDGKYSVEEKIDGPELIEEENRYTLIVPEGDVTLKFNVKLVSKNLNVDLGFEYRSMNGQIIPTLSFWEQKELAEEIRNNAVLNIEKGDDIYHINLKDIKDIWVEKSKDLEGDVYYSFGITDEAVLGLTGECSISLDLEGYNTEPLGVHNMGNVYTVEKRIYKNGVYSYSDKSYMAAGEYAQIEYLVNGEPQGLRPDNKYILDKIEISSEYKDSLEHYDGNYKDENNNLVNWESYMLKMPAADIVISAYYKTNKVENVVIGSDENLPANVLTSIRNNKCQLIMYTENSVITEFSQEMLNTADNFNMNIKEANKDNLNDSDEFNSSIKKSVGNGENVKTGFLDISMFVLIGNQYTDVVELNEPVKIKIVLNDEMYDLIKNAENWHIVRQHMTIDGEMEYDVLGAGLVSLEGNVLTIKTDKFSTYAIVSYTKPVSNTSNSSNSSSGTTVRKPVVNTAAK